MLSEFVTFLKQYGAIGLAIAVIMALALLMEAVPRK